jgi:hypothetical protein
MMRALALVALAGGCFIEPTQPNNLAFVTSTQRSLPIGSSALHDADDVCHTLAATAGVQGTFVAWLSTQNMDAIDRLNGASGWALRDGTPVVDTIEHLAAGTMFVPIDRDETGALVDDDVATATDADGTSASTTYTCDDFMATTGRVRLGLSTTTKGAWTQWNDDTCDGSYRWYCFQTDSTAPFVPPAADGRIAFLSTTDFTPGAGIGAADTICNDEAAAAHLPRNFLALLATTDKAPRDRFGAGAPWVRRDHVLVSTDLATLEAPINVTLDVHYEEGMAWSGTDHLDDASTLSDDSCDDWTDATGSFGRIGYVNSTAFDANLSGTRTTNCSSAHRLWCLQM